MDSKKIRPISICLFRNGCRILVSEDFDSVKQDYFCRPLGGGIEFGESSRDALIREVKEEINLEIENLRLLHIMENIFVCEGQQGHEIVFVYDADFVNTALYQQEEISGYEEDTNHHFKAKWLTVEEMQERGLRLVPEGLAEKLF